MFGEFYGKADGKFAFLSNKNGENINKLGALK